MKPFMIQCHEPAPGAPHVVEVQIGGFLDAHTVVSFEKTMASLMERDYNRFVLDLETLNYISSAGIGALMALLQQLRRRDGDMVILQPSPKVLKILEMLGFTKIFQIAGSRDDAWRALG